MYLPLHHKDNLPGKVAEFWSVGQPRAILEITDATQAREKPE